MKKLFKTQTGITLISLIITIIVLLILAGASISLLTGYDSIPDNAKEAVDASRQDAEDEQDMIDKIGGLFDKYLSITGVYGNLYKISDTEYHLIFNSTGAIAEGYTEAQLVARGSDIRNGIESSIKNEDGVQISSQPWGAYSEKITKLKIEEEIKPKSTERYFLGLAKITEIEGIDNIDTKSVTSMRNMFEGCSSLTSLDLSDFDTKNATAMQYMFSKCSSLTSLNLSGLDTSNVTSMRNLFDRCSNLTNLDLSGFDTKNVTTMQEMFSLCTSLTSLNINNFDTSNVNSMEAMFYGCNSLTSLDLTNFNTSNVNTMNNMFQGCRGLTSLNVSSFDTSNVNKMGTMFYECSNLTSLDLRNFNTSNVTTMQSMFSKCSSLTSLDLSSFDMQNVTTMGWMLSECSELKTIYVGDAWEIGTNIEGSGMFYNCIVLKGAIAYDSTKLDATYANWETGYLTYKNPFITTWKVEAGDTITLPIYEMQATDEELGEIETYFNYNFTVDYGDGTIAEITSFDDADRIHTYAEARRI